MRVKTEIELVFNTFDNEASNPNKLFYLILNSLFMERYGIDIKEFENNYPEVHI